MKYRRLGTTGIEVSELTLGTVELGMDYGFRGSEHSRRPDVADSIRLIHRAVDLGVNLIDTARVYGSSEEVIGRALAEIPQRPYIASKILIKPADVPKLSGSDLESFIQNSVDTSLRTLRIETVDLLQIHQTSFEILKNENILKSLERAKQEGKVRLLGASVTDEEVALEVLANPLFQTLQVAFNVLDQRMGERVFPQALRQGVGILVRSAFLRGVLTPQLERIPEKLTPLKERVYGLLSALEMKTSDLARMALRFCLSNSSASSVIIGVRSTAELEENLAAAREGPIANETLRTLRAFSIENEKLVSPTHWQDLILG